MTPNVSFLTNIHPALRLESATITVETLQPFTADLLILHVICACPGFLKAALIGRGFKGNGTFAADWFFLKPRDAADGSTFLFIQLRIPVLEVSQRVGSGTHGKWNRSWFN